MDREAYDIFYEDAELLRRLIVGIGEVSEITGVAPRQLRYWEDKGIIEPVEPGAGVRRYDYPTVKKVLLIKELLDEGYTLSAAARRVEDRFEQLHRVLGELVRRKEVGPGGGDEKPQGR